MRAAGHERRGGSSLGGERRGDAGTTGQGGDDRRRLGQPAGAGLAFGQRAVLGTDHAHAACGQGRHIRLRGRVQPHAVVHCRGHGQRRGGGQAQRADQIVGQAVGQPRQQVGGGRSDDHLIGPARQFDMSHRLLGGAVPQRGAGGLPGQGLEAERGDELLRAAGHGDLHLRTGVAQATDQFERFVSGNASADAQQQALSVQGRA